MLAANEGLKADHLAELASLIGEARLNIWREILASILAADNADAVAFDPLFMKGNGLKKWNERLRRTANVLEWLFGPAVARVYRSHVQNSGGARRVRCPTQAKIGALCDRSPDTVGRHVRLLRALGFIMTELRVGLNVDAGGRRFASGGRRISDRVTVRALPLRVIEAAETWIATHLGVPLETLLQFEPAAIYALRDRQAAALAVIDRAGVSEVEPMSWRPPMAAKAASVCRRMVDQAREVCGAAAADVFSSILKRTEGGLKTVRFGQGEIAAMCGLSREWVNRVMASLRQAGLVVTSRQAVKGKRYRDQVRVNLSPTALAEREAEVRRQQASRCEEARARTAGTFLDRLARIRRAVLEETMNQREASEASRALRAQNSFLCSSQESERLGAIGATICEVIAGAIIQNEKGGSTAASENAKTETRPRPPPPPDTETRFTSNGNRTAKVAERRSYAPADKHDLATALSRFRQRFEARARLVAAKSATGSEGA